MNTIQSRLETYLFMQTLKLKYPSKLGFSWKQNAKIHGYGHGNKDMQRCTETNAKKDSWM